MDVDVKQARLHLGNLVRRHWKGTHCWTYWGIDGKNKSGSLASRTWTVKVEKSRKTTIEEFAVVEAWSIAAESDVITEESSASVDGK
jgi:hypothetical protein